MYQIDPLISTSESLNVYVKIAEAEDKEFQILLSEFEEATDGLADFLNENKKKCKFGGVN